MPANLPATGSQLEFGRVHNAYAHNPPSQNRQAGQQPGNAPLGGFNIKLSAVLGANATYGINQTAGTQIKFSATFGGRPYPYIY